MIKSILTISIFFMLSLNAYAGDFYGGESYGGSIAIGGNSVVENTERDGVAIGLNTLITNSIPKVNGKNIAVGSGAESHCWRCTSIGAHSKTYQVSGTAVGYGAVSNFPHGSVFGRGAFDTKSGQVILGAEGTKDVYFGNAHSNRYWDMDTTAIIFKWPNKHDITIHGQDAFDRVDGTYGEMPGGNLNLASGVGIGNDDIWSKSGSVNIQTAPVNPGTGFNAQNRLTTGFSVDGNTCAGETRLMLYDIDTGTLRRVNIQPGTGVLYVADDVGC